MNIPLITLCIVVFGIATFFRKLAVDQIHPFQLQIISATIYAVLVPLWIHLSAKAEATTYTNLGIVFGIFANIFYIIGAVAFGFLLKNTVNTGVVSALVSLSPVITLGLSMFFLNEQFSTMKVVAFFFALASAILINF